MNNFNPLYKNDTYSIIRLIIVGLIVFMAFNTFNAVTDGFHGLFGKTRAELISDNKNLTKDITQAVQVNKELEQTVTTVEDVSKIHVSGITEIKDSQVSIQSRTEKRKIEFKKKVDVIDQAPELTEEQKSQEYAEVLIDDLWESHERLTKLANNT